jgi:hypothetical protein
MAVDQNLQGELICDSAGNPLHPDALALLKSLDKLLTLGAYYSTGHEQYLLAADEAARAIRAAIAERPRLAVEITSEGLVVLGQCTDPDHRHIRQIHDLLVPLNIARLEIGAGLTADDLRQALEVLHRHKLNLGKSTNFTEIVIEGLPATMRSVSRSVLQSEGRDEGPGREEGGPAESASEHERLAGEFMELVARILDNLEQHEVRAGLADSESGNVELSLGKIRELKAALKRLLDFNPSPRELVQLIAHARSALDISGDPRRADLVFQILRKDILERFDSGPGQAQARAKPVRYKLAIDQLAEAVAALDQAGAPIPEPGQGALASHLAVCLNLLASEPNDALRQSLIRSLAEVVASKEFEAQDLGVCQAAIGEALDSGFPEWVDTLLLALTPAIRQGNRNLIGPFWKGVREVSRNEDLFILWPHLVNDILLGLGRVNPETGRDLLLWAGQISREAAAAQVERLQGMPALQGARVVGDLFKIPLVLLYPVHRALAATSLKQWLSRGLHASMKARPFNPAVRGLMAALPYDPSNLEFYLELIGQAGAEELAPELRSRVAAILLGILNDLPRARRSEKWVPVALDGLARLGSPESDNLFRRVRDARRWIFLREWPADCREIARMTLSREGD